jgi:ATP/maltotriose-dependent transcriptional regulator MalT
VTQRGLSAPSNAGEREWLLTAKLSVTRLRSDLLHRIRLLGALDEASRRELVLVCAPAGDGETTLLASWARRRTGAVAWRYLDPTDTR